MNEKAKYIEEYLKERRARLDAEKAQEDFEIFCAMAIAFSLVLTVYIIKSL